MCIKFAHIVDDNIAKMFWNGCILNPRQADGRAIFIDVIGRIRPNILHIPDARSRCIIGETLDWAEKYIDEITFHSHGKNSRKGHFPNVISFSNLLVGIEKNLQKVGGRCSVLVHDEQQQFKKVFKTMHEIISSPNMPKDIHLLGMETCTGRCVEGSCFEMKASRHSAGVQIVDIATWILNRVIAGEAVGDNARKILMHVSKLAHEFEVSLEGMKFECINMLEKLDNAPIDNISLDKATRLSG